MNYRNSEMKIDQFVSYLNEEKINLSPAFQRGHVWSPSTRKKLLKNVLQGKPIPAVFLYKEASGAKYSYNILDGKQRLESIILFIGNKSAELSIPRWDKYLFGETYKKHVDFEVELPEGKKAFADLSEEAVRDFREYTIPSIEISLGDDSSLDEVISLFVDINQQGVPVNRFDIVKAMNRGDALLRSVFALLSLEQRRGQDIFYRMIRNDITRVLKALKVVESAPTANAKIDRMWERLLEIVNFYRTKTLRKPVDILKSFIGGTRTSTKKLSSDETRDLRRLFQFLQKAYSATSLRTSRLATDQTYFYTMITTLIKNDLVANGPTDLQLRLMMLAGILDSKVAPPRSLRAKVKRFEEESKKQTTDQSRRSERDRLFLEMIHEVLP
jgi:Protein of unknown function DUF262